MSITAEDVRILAKLQLRWLDRNLTFKRALRAIPHLQISPNEQVVSLLIGTIPVLERIRLLVLTTETIHILGPLWRVEPSGRWPGEQISFLSAQENAVMRINFEPGVIQGGRPDYVDVRGVNPITAGTFIALANALCVQQLWGNSEGFMRFIMEATGAAGSAVP